MQQWRHLIAAMLELHRKEGLDLLVIDPLAVFLPGSSENLAGMMTECLLPLRELTDRGVAVLLLHHPRKGKTRAGQAARGSGALASHVDILVEMHWYANPESDDRRRWLRAYSRFEETPRHLVLELTAAGNDYLVCAMGDAEIGSECSRVLLAVIQEAGEPLTQRQILAHWPSASHQPDLATVSRSLKRGLEQGLIQREGTGRRNDQYRYWLNDAPPGDAGSVAGSEPRCEPEPPDLKARPEAAPATFQAAQSIGPTALQAATLPEDPSAAAASERRRLRRWPYG
jgi:hypothetical protein